MGKGALLQNRGPFQADQLRSGDPYELSNGHPIQCLPTGGRGSRAILVGGSVLDSDPDVDSAGVDTGCSPEPGTLRAPDVAVGNVPDEPGWVRHAPPLAVEYADVGQDEDDLATKIGELFAACTKIVWVVRLTGPRRVEIYEPEKPMRLAHQGDELHAPGILRNPVPVAALYDRETAHEVVLRNLLQRQGYSSLDEVKDSGRAEGEARTLKADILDVLEARGLAVDDDFRAAVDSCNDQTVLRRWHRQAVTADSVAEILGSDGGP